MSTLCEYVFGKDDSKTKDKVENKQNDDNLMHCKEIKYKSCAVKSLDHDVRGNNMDGKFHVNVTPLHRFGVTYNSIAINSAKECEALIDCLIDIKDSLS